MDNKDLKVPEFTQDQIEKWVESEGYRFEREYQLLYDEYGDLLPLWSQWIRWKATEELRNEFNDG